jgi:hypothetical protein
MVLSCGKGIMMQFFKQRCKYRINGRKNAIIGGKNAKKSRQKAALAICLSPFCPNSNR